MLKLAQPVILLVLLAVLLAYIMDPIVVLLERLRVPLWLATSLVSAVFLAVFYAVGNTVFVNLLSFARVLPTYQEKLLVIIQSKMPDSGGMADVFERADIASQLRSLPIATMVITAARSVFSVAARFLIVFFFAVLFVMGKHHLTSKLAMMFPDELHSRMPVIIRHIDASLRKYIGVKALISLSIATLTSLTLMIFGVGFPMIWGLLTFVLNFIPYLGSIVATILPSLFALAQFGITPDPLWVFITLTALQNITGNLLDPAIMGETLNLALLVVFFALLFWGWLWGPAGVLLAVPMTTSIKIVLENIPETSRLASFLEKTRRSRRTGARSPGDNPDRA